MLVRFAVLLLAVFTAVSCGDSKKSASRDGKKGASDCREKSGDATTVGSNDPWSAPLGLTHTAVSFEDIKPILTASCVSCHAGYDTYAIAQANAELFIARMDMNVGDTGFMPKDGQKISLEDRSRFIAWKFAGFPETAADTGHDEEGGNPTADDDGWLSDDDDC